MPGPITEPEIDFLRRPPRLYIDGEFAATDGRLTVLNPATGLPLAEVPLATELDAGSLYVMRRHVGLEHVYGAAPKAVEAARSYFVENAEAMAPRIGKSGQYVMGDQFSVADILLMTCLDWAVTDRIPLSDTLHEYRARVAMRPAYQKALERNFPPRG